MDDLKQNQSRNHKAVLLVDGNNIAWRAAAVVGLDRFREAGDDLSLKLLDNMLNKRERGMADDGYTVVCPVVTFDAGPGDIVNDAKVDRWSYYDGYKANRVDDHTDPDRTEMNHLRTIWKDRWRDSLLSREIPVVEHECVEGDDLMSYGSVLAADAPGVDAAIWTSDKDLMQCVDDRPDHKVIMYRKRTIRQDGRRRSVERLVDGKEVVAEKGVPPSKVRMQLALVGDGADNYPGISGYGGKLGLKLVNQADDIHDLKKLLADSLSKKGRDDEVEQDLATLERNWTLAGCGRDWMPTTAAQGTELAVNKALTYLAGNHVVYCN